jgi:hypothetical protein
MRRQIYRSILEIRVVNPYASVDREFFLRLNKDALKVS